LTGSQRDRYFRPVAIPDDVRYFELDGEVLARLRGSSEASRRITNRSGTLALNEISPTGLTRRNLIRGGLGLAALAGSGTVAACAGGSGGGTGVASDGTVSITMWHGQADQGKATLDKLVAQFAAKNPKIQVTATSGGVLADSMLQKITTALASGQFPDIAYIFGPDIASVARSPKVAHLGTYTAHADVNWADFYPAARDAVTVGGEPRGFPALVDNLCVAYNKKVFADAGMRAPAAGWTWDDFTTTARQLTNASKGIFGTGWPADGGEDCVWRIYPLIWDLGGDILSQDGKTVAFDGDSGLKALSTVNQLAKDKSVYPDTKPGSETMYQIFNNNKMGMIPTGPWQLPSFIDSKTDYGVVPLPTFNGKQVTIAGPDTWTVFDNGSARIEASVKFLTFLTEGAQDVQWAGQAGSLPLRNSTAQTPEWKKHVAQTVGLDVFSTALTYARTRPTIRNYPKISQPLGQAIVKMLLDKASPQDALNEVVRAANAALATG
jgi:multiple sugar transport system substrate-binding protein